MKEEEKSHYYFGVIYWNPDNKKIFVPKRFGVGYTINFGHPLAIVVLVAIIVVVTLLAKFF